MTTSDKARELGLAPIARVHSVTLAGDDPGPAERPVTDGGVRRNVSGPCLTPPNPRPSHKNKAQPIPPSSPSAPTWCARPTA